MNYLLAAKSVSWPTSFLPPIQSRLVKSWEQKAALRDRGWVASIGLLDAALRWHYSVHEYTSDPECVFRVALAKADRPLLLADGTLVHVGGLVCCLHYWNEHLPRFPESGPDLGWAQAMRARIQHSLQDLCVHVEREPGWQKVEAIRADAPLPLRPRARTQMHRLARRHGFETDHGNHVPSSRIRSVAENMLLWGFLRAYNPPGLPRHSLRQGRQPLWLSRKSLLARYGTPANRPPG